MTGDDKALVEQLRDEADTWGEPKHADEIDMRGKLHTAADRIEAQAVEIEQLLHDLERQMTIANEHVNEAEAHYDRGYYDGFTNLLEQHEALREALVAWRIYFEARAVLADCERNRDTTKRFDNALYKIEDAENMAKTALAALEQSK
jgi:hypothetical protein